MADSYEGFSIRGYVSKMRDGDARKCWPFNRGDEVEKLQQEEVEKLLPPMECRQAVWWMHELERERAAEGEQIVGPVEVEEVGERGVVAIREEEPEVERELVGLKVCPVCEIFTASTMNTVNAHIDGCLVEAAPKVEQQRRHGRRRKSKVPKKRSLAELLAVSRPVVSARHRSGDGEKQEEEESPAAQQEEEVGRQEVEATKKRKNNSNLNQTTRKMMKKELIKGQTQKLKMQSGYNYFTVHTTTSLRGMKRSKVVSSIILQMRKQARRSLLKVHTYRLIAKLNKDASVLKRKRKSTADLNSDAVKQLKISKDKHLHQHVSSSGKDDIIELRKPCPSLESPEIQITDEAASLVVDQPMECSDRTVVADSVEKTQAAHENVGAVRLEKTVDLNQDIHDTVDVQIPITTGTSISSDVPSVSGVAEATGKRFAMQSVPGMSSSESAFLPVNQQTIRLMGKNVTVGRLEELEQCRDDWKLWRGKKNATEGAFHIFQPLAKDVSEDRGSYLKEVEISKKLPRVVPVRSVEASSSRGGPNLGPHQFPFTVTQGFVSDRTYFKYL